MSPSLTPMSPSLTYSKTATAQCLDSSDNGTPSTSFIVAYTTVSPPAHCHILSCYRPNTVQTFNEITPMANKVGDAADRVAAYPYCAHIKDSLSGLNLAINKSYNDIKTKCYGSVNSTPCCAAGSAPDPPGCSITSCSATPDLDTAWKASMAAVNAAIGKYDLICKSKYRTLLVRWLPDLIHAVQFHLCDECEAAGERETPLCKRSNGFTTHLLLSLALPFIAED